MQPQNQSPDSQADEPAVPAPVSLGTPSNPAPAAPAPAPTPVQPPAPVPQPQAANDQADLADDEYDDEPEDDQPEDLTNAVNWQAKEFIHQEKDGLWYALFGITVAVLMALAIFVMGSWTFAVLLVVIAGAILVLAKRPPRVMSYSLSDKGLHIGDTLHSFSDFRAFGVIHDGQEYSVMLIPTKRFMPGVSVYFPEESGEQIVDALGSRLPMQDLKLDIIDRVVHKLRLG